MHKPQLLRQHLLAAIPSLTDSPERLLIFVEDGSLAGTYRPGLSYECRYTLQLVLTDFAGPPEAVMLPLLQWLTRHQAELLATPANRERIRFEVDVLSGDTVDLAITLPLTERVRVTRDAVGQLQLQYLAEPPTEIEHADTLAGGELIAQGEHIATLPALAHE